MSILWLGLAILSKFAIYLGSLVSCGTVIMLGLAPGLTGVGYKLRRLIVCSACLGLVGSISGAMVLAAQLSGHVSGMVDKTILTLILDTNAGSALIFRVVGFGLLICAMCLHWVRWPLAALGIAAVLGAFLRSGHIPSLEQEVVVCVLLLHLSIASFWIGVLAPLGWLLSQSDHPDRAVILADWFGTYARALVPLLFFAGLFMSWHLVDQFRALFNTQYGILLLAKVTCSAVVLGAGAMNNLRHVPALRAGDHLAARRLSRTIRFEWLVFVSILFVTAVLTSVVSPPQ